MNTESRSSPSSRSAAPAFDLVLFGGTGDLAMRRAVTGSPSPLHGRIDPRRRTHTRRRSLRTVAREDFVSKVETKCRQYLGEAFKEDVWAVSALLGYVKVDATHSQDYQALSHALAGPRRDRSNLLPVDGSGSVRWPICRELSAAGIVTPTSRIMLEKPLGEDGESANRINDTVGAIARESQIYRIDHYLGKETVQNLLALRFGNSLFEPLWRRGQIRHVQITVAEQLGVESRGDFYDRTGALRDMVQNHRLQLLCILAMEPPANSSADAVRDEKLKVLRALRPIGEADALLKTARGQYRAGVVGADRTVGYREEAGVDPESRTETFVAIKAEIDTWRWAGVPFYLRTGKRLQRAIGEIVITFDAVAHSIFSGPFNADPPYRLVIQLQPDESITLRILAKAPGRGDATAPR
jgi:glucose-6-phosphate 1-dehydrogenase